MRQFPPLLRRVVLSLVIVACSWLQLVTSESSSTYHGHPLCSAIPGGETLTRRLLPAYDFIVVGAGAAGSIVSATLATEFPQHSILLLEAGVTTGNADNANIADPALWLNVLHNDTLEWLFQTVPQVALNNRTIDLGFAKGTGGSAMHNAMGYVRGGQRWMDGWETDNNCPGWNSATLIPAFDAFEAKMNMVAPANDTQGLVNAIFEAANSAGFPYNPSYNNGPDMFGIANFVMSINEIDVEVVDSNPSTVGIESFRTTEPSYRRVTSYQTFIEESNIPANLQMESGMLALHVSFVYDSDEPQVSSIWVFEESLGCVVQIAVTPNTGEVILSTGTINSPAILQRSGIGNATDLQALGITLVSDLPGVGQNLRDDIVVNLVYTSDTLPIDSPPASFLSAVLFAVDNSTTDSTLSVESGTGNLTNIELLFSTGNMISNSWPSDWQNSLVLSPNVQQCRSRGSVKINSTSPFDKPLIDTAYLTVPSDVDRVINSIKLSRQIVLGQPALTPWNFVEVQPGEDIITYQQLVDWVHANAGTGFHYIGTCKMGSQVDEMSVINPLNMNVYGVNGLRVVDASVAPTSFSANTQSLTMAVATRAMQLIVPDIEKKFEQRKQSTRSIETE